MPLFGWSGVSMQPDDSVRPLRVAATAHERCERLLVGRVDRKQARPRVLRRREWRSADRASLLAIGSFMRQRHSQRRHRSLLAFHRPLKLAMSRSPGYPAAFGTELVLVDQGLKAALITRRTASSLTRSSPLCPCCRADSRAGASRSSNKMASACATVVRASRCFDSKTNPKVDKYLDRNSVIEVSVSSQRARILSSTFPAEELAGRTAERAAPPQVAAMA